MQNLDQQGLHENARGNEIALLLTDSAIMTTMPAELAEHDASYGGTFTAAEMNGRSYTYCQSQLDLFPFIPKGMKCINNWVLYVIVNGRKIPHSARTLKPANVADSTTLSSYAETLAAYQANLTSYNGIGFVQTDDNNIVSIDIDNCVDSDGNILPEAQDIINRVNSYTELSQSSKGIHIYVYSTEPLLSHKADLLQRKPTIPMPI